MSIKINENTGFTINLKTFLAIGAGMVTIISMWFVLQADIDEAKKLPIPIEPDITRMEFDMKDELIRQTLKTTQEDVEDLEENVKTIEKKIDDLK